MRQPTWARIGGTAEDEISRESTHTARARAKHGEQAEISYSRSSSSSFFKFGTRVATVCMEHVAAPKTRKMTNECIEDSPGSVEETRGDRDSEEQV